MSLLTRVIIEDLERKADRLVKIGYRAIPEESLRAQNELRRVVESLDFFSAPLDSLIHYSTAYNVLSIYLFNPEEIAGNCLDLFIIPRGLEREFKKSDDDKVNKRKLLGFILDESYLSIHEQEQTSEITPEDAHYLKLVQSMARVDINVAKSYSEVYNSVSKKRLAGKKQKKIVKIGSRNEFGIVLE
jgi:hypothetical protein